MQCVNLLRSMLLAVLLFPVLEVVANDLPNLALDKPVTPLTETVAGEPEWVTDGDPATAWWSYQGNVSVAECVVDLGSRYALDRVVLHMVQAEQYRVEASSDGLDWTALGDGAVVFPTPTAITVSPATPFTARYLRYQVGNSQVAYAGLAEIEAYSSMSVFENGFEAESLPVQ